MSRERPTATRWIRGVVLTILVIAAIVFGTNYALRPTAAVVAAKTDIAVRTVPGTVEVKAEFAIELKSEVGGRVIASSLDVGKRVAKNDVLVQIDTADIDLEMERIRNEITAAQRKVELGSTLRPEVLNAKDTLEDLERQMNAGKISTMEFAK